MCSWLVGILMVAARPCLVAGAGIFESVVDTQHATIGSFSRLPESIPFFMLGNFGGAPGSLNNGGDLAWKQVVAFRMGLWADALLPRFVVGLGNNFYDTGVETVNDPAWDEPFDSVYSVDGRLAAYPMVDGKPEAQIQRTEQDTSGRWHMPSRAYSRRFNQATG